MSFFSGLGDIAGGFISDLVTGSKAGTHTSRGFSKLGSSVAKAAGDIGSSIAKGAKRVFGADSFGSGVGALGSIFKEFGGTLGKGIESGKELLKVVDILGPTLGIPTESIKAKGEALFDKAGGGVSKLFEIGAGLGDTSTILKGMGL
jgi:hypothetical protein